MKPLPGTKSFPDEGSNQAGRSTRQRLKRSAAPADRPATEALARSRRRRRNKYPRSKGTPPSFPANTKELLHEDLSNEQRNKAKALGFSPIDNFNEDMLRLNCEAFGGYCGECYPGIPMKRPKVCSPGQGGPGRSNTDGSHQDCSLCKTTGSFQRNRDRIQSSLYNERYSCNQLGFLPVAD